MAQNRYLWQRLPNRYSLPGLGPMADQALRTRRCRLKWDSAVPGERPGINGPAERPEPASAWGLRQRGNPQPSRCVRVNRWGNQHAWRLVRPWIPHPPGAGFPKVGSGAAPPVESAVRQHENCHVLFCVRNPQRYRLVIGRTPLGAGCSTSAQKTPQPRPACGDRSPSADGEWLRGPEVREQIANLLIAVVFQQILGHE